MASVNSSDPICLRCVNVSSTLCLQSEYTHFSTGRSHRLAAARSYPAFLFGCVCPGNGRPRDLRIRTHASNPSGANGAVACAKRVRRGYGCGLPQKRAATHPTRARRWRCCKAKTHCVPPSEGCSSPKGRGGNSPQLSAHTKTSALELLPACRIPPPLSPPQRVYRTPSQP